MPKTSAKRPIAPAPAPRRVRGDDCPMCSRAMHVDDEVITCSECGGEGCTEYLHPGRARDGVHRLHRWQQSRRER